MAKKKWGFLVKIFLADPNTNETFDFGWFEAEGISPYKVVSGSNPYVLGSDDYDHLINAMAMGDFVSKIGDKNTLSVRKLRDPMTNIFTEANQTKQAISAVNLYVTPLSVVSSSCRGEARLKALYNNSLEMVTLKQAIVTSVWQLHYTKNNDATKTYDFVTFETTEKIRFVFKGKDW